MHTSAAGLLTAIQIFYGKTKADILIPLLVTPLQKNPGVTCRFSSIPLGPVIYYQVGFIINFQILISLGSIYLQGPDLLF